MDNTKRIRKIFQNSIFEVFEKMFFVFFEVSEKKCTEYHLLVSIKFSGHVKGEVKIYFPLEVTNLMVRNMLDVAEGEVTEKLLEDCAKESVNMVCGDFLRGYDPSSVFDLSLPVIESLSGQTVIDKIDGNEKVALCFDSSVGMVGALLQFD